MKGLTHRCTEKMSAAAAAAARRPPHHSISFTQPDLGDSRAGGHESLSANWPNVYAKALIRIGKVKGRWGEWEGKRADTISI